MSIDGILVVFAPKILLTPKPADQLLVTTPNAPFCSNAKAKAFKFKPVLLMRIRQALVSSVLFFFILSKDSGVANFAQLSSERPVGWFIENITNFPFTFLIQLVKATESGRSG
ncbi:hypothetical protein D9M68_906460 [compost metagenome]